MRLGQVCCPPQRTACHHESLTDYDYSGLNNGVKVHHFLQGIKSSELVTAINVVWAQPQKYGTDFNATMSYLGKMVIKKGLIM